MPIKLEIVTVERLLYSGEVDMVVAPGADGVMGILPHHAPLLTSLKFGELVVRKAGEEDLAFAIGGGFMEVQPDKVTVLADAAERAEEINVDRATAARDRAKERLEAGNLSMDEILKAELALQRAITRLKVAGKKQTGRR
jgi:F-type H+-transporting ATPase subunit epsilon